MLSYELDVRRLLRVERQRPEETKESNGSEMGEEQQPWWVSKSRHLPNSSPCLWRNSFPKIFSGFSFFEERAGHFVADPCS